MHLEPRLTNYFKKFDDSQPIFGTEISVPNDDQFSGIWSPKYFMKSL